MFIAVLASLWAFQIVWAMTQLDSNSGIATVIVYSLCIGAGFYFLYDAIRDDWHR